MAMASYWKASSGQAEAIVNGVIQKCYARSAGKLWQACDWEEEPVEQRTFARFSTRWQGATAPRRGLDALLDSVESLQGASLLVSELEREILPARVLDYRPEDLDMLMAAGEVVWVGIEPIGDRDGRIALFLAESLSLLLPPRDAYSELSERAQLIVDFIGQRGASFLAAIHEAAGGGFPGDTIDALWQLVWAGIIHNDTLQPLRRWSGLWIPSAIGAPQPTVAPDRWISCERYDRDAARVVLRREGGLWCSSGFQPLRMPPSGVRTPRNSSWFVTALSCARPRWPKEYQVDIDDLSGAQDHGREWLGPPRNVRRWTGRRSIRDDLRCRYAPQFAEGFSTLLKPSIWRHPILPILTVSFFHGLEVKPKETQVTLSLAPQGRVLCL